MSGLSEINPYIVLVSIDNRTQGLFGIDTTGSLLNLSAKLDIIQWNKMDKSW